MKTGQRRRLTILHIVNALEKSGSFDSTFKVALFAASLLSLLCQTFFTQEELGGSNNFPPKLAFVCVVFRPYDPLDRLSDRCALHRTYYYPVEKGELSSVPRDLFLEGVESSPYSSPCVFSSLLSSTIPTTGLLKYLSTSLVVFACFLHSCQWRKYWRGPVQAGRQGQLCAANVQSCQVSLTKRKHVSKCPY